MIARLDGAIIEHLPEQPGDVPQTWADITKAGDLLGYKPTTTFKQGVEVFVAWRQAQLNDTFALKTVCL